MFSSTRAVFFDLDGTLVNTIPLIFACYEHTLAEHLPWYRPSRQVIVGNLGRLLNAILRDYAVAAGAEDPDAAAGAMIETYRAFQRVNLDRLIEPYAGMAEALRELRGRGYLLGLVTSKVEWAARMSYERYGLGDYLSVLVFHDETTRHKPDPEPLLLAAGRVGVPPGEAAYVGDSVHDMRAGKAAGMRTIGALWGPSEAVELTEAGADVLARTPDSLPAWLPATAPR